MFNSEEFIGITEYLTLWERRRINRCYYNQARFYIVYKTPSSFDIPSLCVIAFL